MEHAGENKLGFVDSLRGIAILGVLVIHCGQAGTNSYTPLFQTIVVNGALGVQLFFVTSAFTIFLTYGNRVGKEANLFANFATRRFFRIAPMYYLGIIYFLWQDGLGGRYWLGDETGITLWNVLSNILFIHSINPYWITSIVPGGWSIAVEVCFYCLVPFLFLRIRNLNQAVAMFLITVALRMVFQALLAHNPFVSSERLWREFLFFYPVSQLPVFTCGIILYFLIKTAPDERRIEPVVVFFAGLLLLVQLLTDTAFIFPLHIQCAMAFVVLGYALSRRDFVLLVNPITKYIGKISYSMYLVHFAVLHWLTEFDYVDLAPTGTSYYYAVNYLLRFGCLATLTIVVSTCTYYLIEIPCQGIGKNIVRKRESQHHKELGLA